MVVTVRRQGNMWAVYKNGNNIGNHRKKARAMSNARSNRRRGETLRVQRMDGTYQSV